MRKLNIAVGNSRKAKFWSNKTITFEELCDKLRTPIRTTETVAEYAKLPKSQRDDIKDKGGFVAGHLRDNRRKSSHVVSRSMVVYDIDHADSTLVSGIDKYVKHKAAYYSTHSHTPEIPRIRIGVPTTRDMTPDEFVAVARFYAQENGFLDMVDPCSFLAYQLMHWPTCSADGEYLFGVIDGDELNPDELLARHPNWKDFSLLPTTKSESKITVKKVQKQEDPLTKGGIVGAFCRAYPIQTAIAVYLSDVYAPSVDDNRYDYLPGEGSSGVVIYDDKFAYSHHATDPAGGKLCNAFDLVMLHKFGEDSFKEMAALAEKDKNVKTLLLQERQAQAQMEFDDDSWLDLLEYNKAELKNTLKNLTLILENDPKLHDIVFNQQLDGIEIKGTVPWQHPSKYWRDADDAQLISYIDMNYGSFSERNYNIAVAKVVDDRSYHPIREFLGSLPEWDGIDRVDTLLIDYLGAVDNEYVRAVTRKTLCGAVCRIMNPGCKFDTILVLNGPQGVGKSTLIAKLGGEWFSDSLSLNDTKDKTAAEKLQGYWILEIGELAGLRKAEVETLRSFLSRQNDIYRAAFGKRATPHPRQCIFIGTTNAESGYLRDITGNRRFWPVKTPGMGAKKSWGLDDFEIRQIWAEVMTYVKAGESLCLSPEIEALARYEQRDAMETDEREGLVRNYLDTLLPDNWDSLDLYERRNFLSGDITSPKGTVKRTQVSNLEIWCECFGKDRANITRIDSNALAAMLVKMGWVREPNKKRIPLYGPQYIFVAKP